VRTAGAAEAPGGFGLVALSSGEEIGESVPLRSSGGTPPIQRVAAPCYPLVG